MAANYLQLTMHHLKPREEWVHKEGGLIFLLPRKGAAKCVLGTFNRGLRAGDVLVMNGESGKFCVHGEEEMDFGYFIMRIEHLFPLFDANEIGLLQNVTAEFAGPKYYPASEALAGECHQILESLPPSTSEQVDLGHRSQLLRVAAAVLTKEFKNARRQKAAGGFIRVEDHMVQVFEKLTTDEILALSADELAGKFGCSRRHLNRLFHQYFGFSICGLKMEMRLLRAVSLLRNHDAKIINVAEDSGFNHLGLFNTCFKKRFGTSPGEWRKLNSPSAPSPEAHASILRVHLQKNGLLPFNHDAGDFRPPQTSDSPAGGADLKLRLKRTTGREKERAA